MRPELVCVGAIGGAWGVRGEVRLKSFCAEPEAIATYGPLEDDTGQPVVLSLRGSIKGGLAARVEGVATKEAADAMRGRRLWAPRDRLPSLPDDEFYHADLIGLAVQDPGGAPLGAVRAVLNHGAGDLLEIEREGRTYLLPFTREAVPTVDLEARRIVADPPEGTF